MSPSLPKPPTLGIAQLIVYSSPDGVTEGGETALGGYTRFLIEDGYSPTTVRQYVACVERAERWLEAKGRLPLRRCSALDLEAFGKALPLTNSTRSLNRNALKGYWRYLRREWPKWVIRIPTKAPMVCKALEAEELAALLRAAAELGTRERACLCLLYYAALRRAEAASLRWDNFEGSWLRIVGKYLTEHLIPVHPAIVDALRPLSRDWEYVFPGRYPGTHVSPATVNIWVALSAARAGLVGVSPHRLRHTSLATANDRTGDLRAVQAFARHRNPEVTAGYTRATAGNLQRVVGAL